MEADEIDILASAVFCDFEQIDHSQEARFPGQLRGDIRKADGLDGIDFDLAFFHRVPRAHSYVRTNPDSDAARDFAAPHSLAQAFGKHHEESLYRGGIRFIAQCHRRIAGADLC